MTLLRYPRKIRLLSNFTTIKRYQHVCVIGSGPAGLYASQQLIKSGAKVDVYERLPVPFGLVRYGVAPDHPEVKNVVNTFDKVLSHANVKFVGNVTIGHDVKLEDLLTAYDAVLLSYGSSEDRKLNIPGENFMTSARDFVGWYNGLPENSSLRFDLAKSENAYIIGHGNVALDVARILLSPVDKLAKTDIAKHALDELSKSKIQRVTIVGRRGPLQVSFTIKELRELTQIAQARFDPKDFIGINPTDLPRPKKRLMELMISTAAQSPPEQARDTKQWTLKFLRSPLRVDQMDGKLRIEFGVNELVQEKIVQRGTEAHFADLIFRSVGYQGKRLFQELPWDEANGIIPNVDGKVASGVYVTGWLKTGPKGVILNTMSDAFAVAALIVQDLKDKKSSKAGLSLKIPGRRVTSYADYTKILEYEKKNGKVTTVDEMMKIIT